MKLECNNITFFDLFKKYTYNYCWFFVAFLGVRYISLCLVHSSHSKLFTVFSQAHNIFVQKNEFAEVKHTHCYMPVTGLMQPYGSSSWPSQLARLLDSCNQGSSRSLTNRKKNSVT